MNDSHFFGGMSMLLGGDFRQTLPDQPKSRKSDIISFTLPNSYLWSSFTVFRLHHNMRLSDTGTSVDSTRLTSEFASWLLDIGDGKIGTPEKEDPHSTRIIHIPGMFLIDSKDQGLAALIDFVYGSELLTNTSPQEFSARAIISPKNETAERVNTLILSKTQGQEVVYNSYDSIKSPTRDALDLDTLYPQDYLNNLDFSGVPTHKLVLKLNTPIMLLRNINQREGMCNGTRLVITQLLPSVIEASILTGTCIGKRVYIPRIKFIHNSPDLPFIFTRKQFPVKVCYAMTINKSQGQSLKKVGLFLENSVFKHGQLYVALSRATSPDSIKILLQQEEDLPMNSTKNVVFKDLLVKVEMRETNQQFFYASTQVMPDMDRISNLYFGALGKPLEIRVLRKWTSNFRKKDTWFIIVDKHGDAIQLLEQKKDETTIESKLLLNECYHITDYTCTTPDKYQKILDHTVHINIGEASTIEQIFDCPSLPKVWFRFQLHFIGVLINIRERKKKNKEPFMAMTLADANAEEITILLWKECIDSPTKFDRNVIMSNPNTSVIALTNVKATMYNGSLTLTSSMATYLYINPPISETETLLQRFGTEFRPRLSPTAVTTTLQHLKNSNYSDIETLHSKIVGTMFLAIPVQNQHTKREMGGSLQSFSCCHRQHRLNDNFYATSEELINCNLSQPRDILPPTLERCKGSTKNWFIQCTNLSATNNIRFIITSTSETGNREPKVVIPSNTPVTPMTTT
uniref:ATP-dependent DNA helicase n=1 Tax=Lactuca sativa TaxID=4236 RepID=A0A9R1XIJ2_LACSA|nr:hypothetical protein LSAT_V11C400164520 [Lactuca sativa]